MRRVTAASVGSVLALALLPTGAANAEPVDTGPEAAPRLATPQGVLVSQRVTLTSAHRVPGLPNRPNPPEPGRTIARADVTIEVGRNSPIYFYSGSSLTLAGDPPHKVDYAGFAFGNMSGGRCRPNTIDRTYTSTDYGRKYTFHGYKEGLSKPWDCVAAWVESDQGGGAYDILEGRLVNTYQKPKLALGKVTLLGQNQKKRLRLVKGVPTQIDVIVRNTGPVAARDVVVRGNGKRLKVSRAKIAVIDPGRTATVSLKVRVQGKKKPGKLRLVASGTGAKATKRMNVKRIKPPQRPRAGKYRSTKSGSVTFAVRKGRITNWRGRMTTRCGGYPDNFTYQTGTVYDFPRTKIPRNGIVQARHKGKNFSTHLRLRIAGGKVTRGQFTYHGPNRCFATTSFKAKRIGG